MLQHIQSEHEWTAKVEMYLGVFNDSGRFTLPANANFLYRGQTDPSELFKRMALQILGEMLVRNMPISNKFKALLGPAYASSSEMEEESEEESGWDSGEEKSWEGSGEGSGKESGGKSGEDA